MSLTFGKAKELCQPYCGASGKAFDSKELHDFTIKALQYLLIAGSPGGEKLFEINAGPGFLTVPYELESPLKMIVNGRVGNSVNQWFEFRSKPNNCDRYLDCADLIIENTSSFYTAYDGPDSGFQVGIKATQSGECNKCFIVSGQDASGREVFTQHKGAHISGELLEVPENAAMIKWTNVFFTKITGVVKEYTSGYLTCYWRDHKGNVGFLSDYSPVETAPSYRRFQLNIPNCPEFSKISIIGRTRLKESYMDNDRVPFSNFYNIEICAQQIQSQLSKQPELASQQHNFLKEMVELENTHKKINNGLPIEQFYYTSGNLIQGIVRRTGIRRRWGW
jgi:hypothetical protein